jgi:protein-S-isoprenylcysteine O-methyltransferase Ste14
MDRRILTKLDAIAARRTVKISGVYALVRHPMYVGEALSITGYMVSNISLTNVVLALCAIGLLWARAGREELFLSTNDEYQAYGQRVRWKFVPFLW